jgi:hypothetical protein
VEALRQHGRQWRKIEGARTRERKRGVPALSSVLQYLPASPCPLELRTRNPAAAPRPLTITISTALTEHVKTKTAVQIRSHAQKFFSKIEKHKQQAEEAGRVVQGPTGDPSLLLLLHVVAAVRLAWEHAQCPPSHPHPLRFCDHTPSKHPVLQVPVDLQIPPPRPKRRAGRPYPRTPRDEGAAALGGGGAAAAAAAAAAHTHRIHRPDILSFQQALPDYAAAAHGGEVEVDITVAAVTAAASAAAAAAAAAVVAAAGRDVECRLQAAPPPVFPFYGLTPAMLRAMSNPATIQANIQATIAAASIKNAARDGGGERSACFLFATKSM